MAHRFSGTIAELKTQLAPFNTSMGNWIEVNPNQYQFCHKDGGIMNWFPSTGTINFQGKPENRDTLEKLFLYVIQSSSAQKLEGVEAEPAKGSSQPTDSEPSKVYTKAQDSVSKKPTEFSPGVFESFSESELIIGLVGAVGTEMD